MQKRGQIFILAALLLGFIVFLLVSETVYVRRNVIESNFDELNDNYEREAAKFINELVKYPKTDIGDKFFEFTTSFTAYSKGQNPNFELVYAFDQGGNLHVGNYLSNPLDVYTQRPSTYKIGLPGCFEKIKSVVSFGGLSIDVGGTTYSAIQECIWSAKSPGDENEKTYPLLLVFGNETFGYGVDITVGVPEVIIISREQSGMERKVFTKGNFLKGKEVEKEFGGKI